MREFILCLIFVSLTGCKGGLVDKASTVVRENKLDMGADVLKNISSSTITGLNITIPEITGIIISSGAITGKADVNIKAFEKHDKPIVLIKEIVWNKNIPDNVQITKQTINYRWGKIESQEIETIFPVKIEDKSKLLDIIIFLLLVLTVIGVLYLIKKRKIEDGHK